MLHRIEALISEKRVLDLINEKLKDSEFFIVELSINPGNKIYVELDGPNGFPISECINYSRQIEHNLDREEEDFALEVSSPGLTKPFRVFQQYTKNVGRQVKVKTLEGNKINGKLMQALETEIQVETRQKVRLEGKKKKVEQVDLITIPFEEIKETKLELIF